MAILIVIIIIIGFRFFCAQRGVGAVSRSSSSLTLLIEQQVEIDTKRMHSLENSHLPQHNELQLHRNQMPADNVEPNGDNKDVVGTQDPTK